MRRTRWAEPVIDPGNLLRGGIHGRKPGDPGFFTQAPILQFPRFGFHVGRPAVMAAGLLMKTLKQILSDRRFHRLAGGLLVAGAGAVLLAWKLGVDGAMLKSAWHRSEDYLMIRPWLLFAVLVVLPGLPVPTSALLFLAGTVWRDRPVTACAICLVAMALNMTWTYWLAARPGRGLVEKLLAATTLRIPELPLGNHLRMVLVLRLTPGLPLFVQNYLLGFFRVPFRLYLPVSMGCSGLIASGVVLSGAGVANGSLTPVLTGAGLIVLGWVVVRMIRQRLQGTAPGAGSGGPGGANGQV